MIEANSSESRTNILSTINNVIVANESFLFDHTQSVYGEAMSLFSDFINNSISVQPHIQTASAYSASSLAFFLYHTLSPFSVAIYTSLLVGNLPGCFMMLRLLTEAFGNCLLADREYGQMNQFSKRLQFLQESKRRTTDILLELDKSINYEKSAVELWKSLSSDWAHASRYAPRLTDTVSNTGTAPSWSLMIPNTFGEEDIEILTELGTAISIFREIANKTISQWDAVP